MPKQSVAKTQRLPPNGGKSQPSAMAGLSVVERLRAVVENAVIVAMQTELVGVARAGGPDLSAAKLAERLMETEADLIAEWLDQIRLSALVALIRKTRAALIRREQEQLVLPGFERIPLQIEADGRRFPLIDATYWDVKRYLIALRKRQKNQARIKQAKALVDLMREYSREVRGITVREVFAREAGRAV